MKVTYLVVLALILFVTAGCTQPASQPPTTVPKESPTPATSPATTTEEEGTGEKLLGAREAYDLAVERASASYGKVHLWQLTAGGGTVGLSTLYEKVDDEGRATKWEVEFFHPEDGTIVQVYVVVENGGVESVSVSEPMEKYFEWNHYLKYDLVDIETVKITSADAVRIANENGGNEFTRIMLRLVKSQLPSTGEVYPEWIVAFGPGTREEGEHPGLIIRINAETGEVVDKETKMYHIY